MKDICLYMNFESSKKHMIMLSIENLKAILPGIVTRVAINYPIAYINSVSFIVKNTIVAACFWSEKYEEVAKRLALAFHQDNNSGCLFFKREPKPQIFSMAKFEITGAPMKKEKIFVVSLPYQHLIRYRMAS
ncbi:MAG: hypothetical protein IPL12_08390 [Bacteroidetes bacterium]|nr:hypothetical protein [Bacteroidota bacterium]